MYLFDTDIVSNLIKARPSARLLAKLRPLSPDLQYISAVTVAELACGASRSEKPDRSHRLIAEQILTRVGVLGFDGLAALRAGDLRAALEKSGLPLAWADLQIAATALVHNCTLVTGNLRHFSRIPGLRVENWL